MQVNPDNISAYQHLGFLLLEYRKYGEAIKAFNKAIELDSNDHASFNNRGKAKAELMDYKGAIDDHYEAFSLNPENAEYLFNRAFAKKQSGNIRGAVRDLNEVLEIKENDSNAKSLLQTITKKVDMPIIGIISTNAFRAGSEGHSKSGKQIVNAQ